jgi:hypothetical protein
MKYYVILSFKLQAVSLRQDRARSPEIQLHGFNSSSKMVILLIPEQKEYKK